MKKTITIFCAAILLSAITLSCREKTTGEKVEDAVESVGDKIEDGAEEVKDAVEDATDGN